ncbi:MAG TPA: hypothetical protein VD767_05525 [Thermomicrobiales bacterium]|nr:hypothetical protein [Thermomicrobiales bacterium]
MERPHDPGAEMLLDGDAFRVDRHIEAPEGESGDEEREGEHERGPGHRQQDEKSAHGGPRDIDDARVAKPGDHPPDHLENGERAERKAEQEQANLAGIQVVLRHHRGNPGKPASRQETEHQKQAGNREPRSGHDAETRWESHGKASWLLKAGAARLGVARGHRDRHRQSWYRRRDGRRAPREPRWRFMRHVTDRSMAVPESGPGGGGSWTCSMTNEGAGITAGSQCPAP